MDLSTSLYSASAMKLCCSILDYVRPWRNVIALDITEARIANRRSRHCMGDLRINNFHLTRISTSIGDKCSISIRISNHRVPVPFLCTPPHSRNVTWKWSTTESCCRVEMQLDKMLTGVQNRWFNCCRELRVIHVIVRIQTTCQREVIELEGDQ